MIQFDGKNTYKRRVTCTVIAGNLKMGSDFPLRIQSMTTANPLDTRGSVAEAIRIIESGSELVRFTTPDIRSAENLINIKREIRAAGYETPLVADIHFTPHAAETAARFVEKVRINPGNYAEKKNFRLKEYSERIYQDEIERIRERFLPLIHLCKQYGTALRIGINHGSLSDRIMSRYGDTPLGMVESALEFIRICEDESFYNIVLSMKASNPLIMMESNRLLAQKLAEEKLKPYPLHLGVTEAGDGQAGRVKSAVGIGLLMEDGLGDTIRVSLTEPPENEHPVAFKIIERFKNRTQAEHPDIFRFSNNTNFKTNFPPRKTPQIIADFSDLENIEKEDLETIGYFYSPESQEWKSNDFAVDYIYTTTGNLNFTLPSGLKQLSAQTNLEKQSAGEDLITLVSPEHNFELNSDSGKFVLMNLVSIEKHLESGFSVSTTDKILVKSTEDDDYNHLKYLLQKLRNRWPENELFIWKKYETSDFESVQVNAAIDLGGILLEGLADGMMIQSSFGKNVINQLCFEILQASRLKITKTEFISCPSCGRTQFDLMKVTREVKQKTAHLKGLKIAVMGCIVNGPGEMADADYGYVGAGKNKISLYRGQEVVKKNIASEEAVDELISIIRKDGKWIEQIENFQ